MGKKNLVSKPICFHKYIINWFNFCPCQLRPTRIHYFYTRPIRSIIFHRKKKYLTLPMPVYSQTYWDFQTTILVALPSAMFQGKEAYLVLSCKGTAKGFHQIVLTFLPQDIFLWNNRIDNTTHRFRRFHDVFYLEKYLTFLEFD